MTNDQTAAPTLYVVRAFCVAGQRVEPGTEFAYDPKADRVLVAELKAAGKLSADKPDQPVLVPTAEAEAAAKAAAEAEAAAKASKKG
jgi:hypothetical protein